MKALGKGNKPIVIGLVLLFFGVYTTNQAAALWLQPQNIQALAVYGPNSNYGIGLLNSINFNITDPAVINSLISAVEFSVERDCSGMGGESGAYVYVKFLDGTIEVYDLYDSISHFSKVGLHGSCHFISEAGQALFESLVQ